MTAKEAIEELNTLRERMQSIENGDDPALWSFLDGDFANACSVAIDALKEYDAAVLYDGGRCVSSEEALAWVESIQTDDIKKDYVLNRMKYAFSKDKATKLKFHKGVHGKRYDYYTCGHCGTSGIEACARFCFRCGYRIDKRL